MSSPKGEASGSGSSSNSNSKPPAHTNMPGHFPSDAEDSLPCTVNRRKDSQPSVREPVAQRHGHPVVADRTTIPRDDVLNVPEAPQFHTMGLPTHIPMVDSPRMPEPFAACRKRSGAKVSFNTFPVIKPGRDGWEPAASQPSIVAQTPATTQATNTNNNNNNKPLPASAKKNPMFPTMADVKRARGMAAEAAALAESWSSVPTEKKSTKEDLPDLDIINGTKDKGKGKMPAKNPEAEAEAGPSKARSNTANKTTQIAEQSGSLKTANLGAGKPGAVTKPWIDIGATPVSRRHVCSSPVLNEPVYPQPYSLRDVDYPEERGMWDPLAWTAYHGPEKPPVSPAYFYPISEITVEVAANDGERQIQALQSALGQARKQMNTVQKQASEDRKKHWQDAEVKKQEALAKTQTFEEYGAMFCKFEDEEKARVQKQAFEDKTKRSMDVAAKKNTQGYDLENNPTWPACYAELCRLEAENKRRLREARAELDAAAKKPADDLVSSCKNSRTNPRNFDVGFPTMYLDSEAPSGKLGNLEAQPASPKCNADLVGNLDKISKAHLDDLECAKKSNAELAEKLQLQLEAEKSLNSQLQAKMVALDASTSLARDLMVKLDKTKSDLKNAKSEARYANQTLYRVQRDIDHLKKKEDDVRSLRESLKEKSDHIAKMEREKADFDKKHEILVSMVKNVKTDKAKDAEKIAGLQKLVADLQTKLQEAEAENAKSLQTTKKVRRELGDELADAAYNLQVTEDECKKKLEIQQRDLNKEWMTKNKAIRDQLHNARTHAEQMCHHNRLLDAQSEKHRIQAGTLHAKVQDLELRNTDLLRKIEELSSENTVLRDDYDIVEADVSSTVADADVDADAGADAGADASTIADADADADVSSTIAEASDDEDGYHHGKEQKAEQQEQVNGDIVNKDGQSGSAPFVNRLFRFIRDKSNALPMSRKSPEQEESSSTASDNADDEALEFEDVPEARSVATSSDKSADPEGLE